MIKGGTKVIVLTSSLRKKTGPRKGSVGYVVQLNRPGGNIFYYEEEDVFVHLVKVMFTRYGSETNKQRNETKSFLNILPSFSGLKLAPKGLIDSNIAKTENIETSGNFWEQLKGLVTTVGGQNNVHGGILVPLPFTEDSLLRFGANEFRSWLTSLLMDHNFRNTLYIMCNVKIGQERNLARVLDLEQVRKLRTMSIDRKYRNVVLNNISTTNDRILIVDTVRKIMSVAYAQEYRRNTSGIKKYFMATDLGRANRPTLTTALKTLITDFYSDVEFPWKEAMLLGKNRSVKRIILILSYFAEMRDRLGCLAQSLEEGNDNGKGTFNV